MEEFITASIITGLFYAVLRFFKISWLKQAFPPSFIYLAGVFAWCTALALLASVISFVSMSIDVFSAMDADSLIPFAVILIALGIGTKLLMDRKQVLDIPHMIPFLRAAITFQPYDARRQELFERNERYQLAQAKKAAAERVASGQAAQEVIDISEDSGDKQEGASSSTEVPEVTTELDLLKRGEGVDITELFKTNSAQLPSHPLYQFMSLMRVDPSEKVMSFKMVLPSSATEPELTPEKLLRVKQGVYQVFQTLTAEQWLNAYLPFFTSIKTACFRVRKDEFDMIRESLFMSIQADVAQVRQNRGKPFNSAEFDKTTTIVMEG